ncbi:MAG: OmpA family protein [Ferruginibacter sp.]
MPQYLPARLLITLWFTMLLSVVMAQNKYGFFAGAGKTSLYKFPYSPDDYDRYSGSAAFWGGLQADIRITKSGISAFANLSYGRKGFSYAMSNSNGAANTVKDSSYKQQLNYGMLGLLLVKKFAFGQEYEELPHNSFFAGTGPEASFFLSGKESTSMSFFGSSMPAVSGSNSSLKVGNTPGSYNRMHLGWSFIAGVELNKLKLWASATIPLGYYYQDPQKSVQHKLKTIGINAGYTLFSNVKKEKPVKQVPYIPTAADSTKDSDGDGILDVNDKCPGHKGTAKYNGCPVPDTDGDGIDDDHDKCIDVAGVTENNGCPPVLDTVKASTPDTARFIIYFEPAKSILRAEGYNVMSQVVQMMKANSKLVVLFKGHTDNAGNAEANFKRSQERVSVCAAYIESFYIDKKRVFTASYGNTMPVADLKDPLVQWKNRRVEVLVYEKKD